MRKLVWRTPRPGAEPMRGAEAARWYLRFFRDPIGTLAAGARALRPRVRRGQRGAAPAARAAPRGRARARVQPPGAGRPGSLPHHRPGRRRPARLGAAPPALWPHALAARSASTPAAIDAAALPEEGGRGLPAPDGGRHRQAAGSVDGGEQPRSLARDAQAHARNLERHPLRPRRSGSAHTCLAS